MPYSPMMESTYYDIEYFSNYDTSDHYRHHLYYVVNYGDPLMDKWFGTAFNEVNKII